MTLYTRSSRSISSRRRAPNRAFLDKLKFSECQRLFTFGMHDFNEGRDVLQSVASLWDGGKKVLVREATDNTTVEYAVHYVTGIMFVTLHYVLVILYPPILYRH